MQYQLNYESEIRFGPAYYSLEIDGKKVPNFVYGFTRSELQNGRYLAIEEWLTTDYRKGPITRVAIFDLENKLVSRLKTVEKGFVDCFKLDNNLFSYRKNYHAKGKVVELELDWDSVKEWSNIYS
ncbi:hypothetical protein [Pseudoalteromonas spongiae]|uniref:hypothetical protein n=1 Tax=Pseudoalteromonas spongiae TaxID=298657 RepID=UPI00026CA469|nr:hypothetical protein [Pseudoalteromonas spongiae]